MEHKLVHFAADKTISSILKYIDKEPQKNLLKILSIVEKTFKMYPAENYAKMRNAVLDNSNSHTILAKSILRDVDHSLIKSLLLSLGVHAGFYGTKTVRANREKRL